MREPLDDHQTFRLGSLEKLQLKQKAAELNFPHGPGQLLRTMVRAVLKDGERFLRGAGGVLLPMDHRAIKGLANQVRLAGNLLNQLLLRLNIVAKSPGAEPPTAVEVRALLRQMQDLTNRANALLDEKQATEPRPGREAVQPGGTSRIRPDKEKR